MKNYKVVLFYTKEMSVLAENIHEACFKAEELRKNHIAESVEIYNIEVGLEYRVKIDASDNEFIGGSNKNEIIEV
jgi:hypothetical protein